MFQKGLEKQEIGRQQVVEILQNSATGGIFQLGKNWGRETSWNFPLNSTHLHVTCTCTYLYLLEEEVIEEAYKWK